MKSKDKIERELAREFQDKATRISGEALQAKNQFKNIPKLLDSPSEVEAAYRAAARNLLRARAEIDALLRDTNFDPEKSTSDNLVELN